MVYTFRGLSKRQHIIVSCLFLLVILAVYQFKHGEIDDGLRLNINEDKLRVDGLANDDPKLIRILQEHWIEQPSNEPYNFSEPTLRKKSMFDQDIIADNYLEHMENGFFVEVGAVDGEAASNSYFFETQRKWTGLLVEPDPIAFSMLQYKHRNAYSINSCLHSQSTKVVFEVFWRRGHIKKSKKKMSIIDNPSHYTKETQCFSLYSILLAIHKTRIDFFSLDVEGSEPDVLRGIPFDKVDIRVICVEYVHCGADVLYGILEPHGYKKLNETKFDLIFVKTQNSVETN